MKQFRPIQFIGTQRSGSNLLRVMINQIENIVAFHPPHILSSFYPILPAYGDLKIKENFESLVEDICSWVENNPVPWEQVEFDRKKIIKSCNSATLVEIFRVIYETSAMAHAADYWCCKSMANMNFYKSLEKLSVKPFYLYLFRDGRDVALSFKKAYVGEKHIYSIAKKWKKDQQVALELCDRVPDSRFVKIRYEDLIADSEGVMGRLCHALDIETPNNFFDYHKSQEAQNASSAGGMWENLTKPVLKNNFNKYKKELSVEEISIFESVAGKELRALGYSLENSEKDLSELYSLDELEKFTEENEALKKKIIMTTSDHEKEKKKWHESFMKKMKEKVSHEALK